MALADVLSADGHQPPKLDDLKHAARVIDGLKGLIDGLPAHKVAADFFRIACAPRSRQSSGPRRPYRTTLPARRRCSSICSLPTPRWLRPTHVRSPRFATPSASSPPWTLASSKDFASGWTRYAAPSTRAIWPRPGLEWTLARGCHRLPDQRRKCACGKLRPVAPARRAGWSAQCSRGSVGRPGPQGSVCVGRCRTGRAARESPPGRAALSA